MMSIGEIIYRIQENPLLQAVRKSDIVNHVKTVIELIGVPGLKEEKLVQLTIADYRAQLPSDFLTRKSVRVINGSQKIVLINMTDEFGKFDKELIGDAPADKLYTHRIVNGFIYTDFKEGEIELVYLAYHTDEQGWPMIPRNESVVLAIENYIKARYFRILADNNASFERAWAEADKQYCWYLAQATSSMLTLDLVEAQTLAAAIVRLVPHKDDKYTNYKYEGQPERLNRNVW